jgi:prephenate dehydrogenase
MNIVVIDGQGGRMGCQVIEGIRAAKLPVKVTAVGTNALATAAMLKAGADQGATGENAVVVQCRTADVIVGPIGITLADAMLGEITPAMATAVGSSNAARVLIPSDRCETYVVGVVPLSRKQQIDAAVAQVLALCT